MAIGPVRGKSWGGLHGRLPVAQTGFCNAAQGGTREAGKDHLDSLRDTREAGKGHLGSLRGTREAGKDSVDGTREAGKDQLDSLRGTGRQERINWTACEARGITI